MSLPTERQLLDLWESALDAAPATRATALLTLSDPAAAPESFAHLPLGERDRRLLTLRHRLFGSHLSAVATCPECGERHDVELDLDRLLSEFPPPSADPLTLQVGACAVTLRPVTGADLAVAASAPASERMRVLLARCVVTARLGDQPCESAALSPAVCTAISEALGAADPLADLTIELDCAACHRRWTTVVDAAAYLWHELHRWAQRALRDIHCLAAAYGWTEADVLKVSPWRRAAYLSLSGQ